MRYAVIALTLTGLACLAAVAVAHGQEPAKAPAPVESAPLTKDDVAKIVAEALKQQPAPVARESDEVRALRIKAEFARRWKQLSGDLAAVCASAGGRTLTISIDDAGHQSYGCAYDVKKVGR